MLHRAWWLTQRNTLRELWCAWPWPGNTSLQHDSGDRFDAPVSRYYPQSRLWRDLGTSTWRRVEWLPPATSLKYIFVRWPHPTSHITSQRLLWNDFHGVVRPSGAFPVNLIHLLKAMVKTRKTRVCHLLHCGGSWRMLQEKVPWGSLVGGA